MVSIKKKLIFSQLTSEKKKLIQNSNVEYIATTDDIIDNLEWHIKLNNDESFKATIAPSFRTDNVLLINREGYKDYVAKLSEVSGIGGARGGQIENLCDLKRAITSRLDFFVKNGCKFSDVGIPFFPDSIADESSADATFKNALAGDGEGKEIPNEEFLAFLGNMYVFLGKEYKKRGIISQWHLAVLRNTNSKIYDSIGPDCGVDCIGDMLEGSKISDMLNEMNKNSALPHTIIYTLNSAVNEQLVSVAGAFPGVQVGTAWWFNDHKRGIREMINVIAEVGYIGAFLGMLTDSRSFLSYARHDYFRRILCSIIGEWVESENYPLESAYVLAEKICYRNISKRVKEG